MNRAEEVCLQAAPVVELEENFYRYELGLELEPGGDECGGLVAALRRKEREVMLAAQLGNALLAENRQLKEEGSRMHEQYAEKLEELEQCRHELVGKLEGCRVLCEGQVSELERDVAELSGRVEQLTCALSDAEREKSRNEREHTELIQQLRDQLHGAMEVERTVTTELHNLKQELRERGQQRPQDEELLSALREQVARLTQREQTLTQRLETMCEENATLKDNLSSLNTQLALQEQHSHTQAQQLAEARQEVEAARGKAQELQCQMEELQEETSLQRSSAGDTSLLSEMESSLDLMGWSQEREQVTQEVSSILDLLLPVSSSSEMLNKQENDLQSKLGELRSTVTRIVQELQQPVTGERSESASILELRDQIAQLLEENTELRHRVDSRLNEEVLRAIKDRDDAIAKKTAVEAELVRSKNDMMCLNNQLLDAIQRKLELSQELEAWQDDIQIIINQQLMVQHQASQRPQADRKRSGGVRLSFLRKPRQPSTSPSCAPEIITPVTNQSPWREWLKRGK